MGVGTSDVLASGPGQDALLHRVGQEITFKGFVVAQMYTLIRWSPTAAV